MKMEKTKLGKYQKPAMNAVTARPYMGSEGQSYNESHGWSRKRNPDSGSFGGDRENGADDFWKEQF